MTADELAFRILDQDPSLQLIDVRDPDAFAKTSLPAAVNIPAADIFGRQWHDVLGAPRQKKVFFAEDEPRAVTAATLANLLGSENVAVLQGGLEEFNTTILNVRAPEGELTRAEQDTYRFRLKAAPRIATLIKERGRLKPVRKRVQNHVGGCGV
jgi:rhodanese-related sulfurtransferase